MIGIIRTYLESIHSKAAQRKKIAVNQLEEHVIKAYETQNHYLQAGGYSAFYQAIKQLEKEGLIAPLRSSGMNGRTPPLPTHYWLLPPSPSAKWSEVQMMRVADRLQMARYRQNPSLQTDEEWERIERVYLFLRTSDLREWATREERSLELFGNEKWLSNRTGEHGPSSFRIIPSSRRFRRIFSTPSSRLRRTSASSGSWSLRRN